MIESNFKWVLSTGKILQKTTSLGFYLESFMILLDLLPANFHMNVRSSSQTTAVETTSEDNYPPKLSRAIILFSYVDTS